MSTQDIIKRISPRSSIPVRNGSSLKQRMVKNVNADHRKFQLCNIPYQENLNRITKKLKSCFTKASHRKRSCSLLSSLFSISNAPLSANPGLPDWTEQLRFCADV